MTTLTAVILTKNEEDTIEKTINNLSFCNEVIIIDDYSSDKTIEIAKKNKAIVFKKEMNNDFASQRNFGLEKAKGEWVLFIDADEEVTDELRKEIQQLIRQKNQYPISNIQYPVSAYSLKRRDFWMERELKYGETRKVRNNGIIRLVKKDSGKWMGSVHEIFHTADRTGSLKNYLNHYPHPTVGDFISDINFYSTIRAKELFNKGKKTNMAEIILYPLFKFILTYFVYLGMLDRVPGFAYSFFMSFHSFLVRAKLYQYENKFKS